MPVSAQLCLPQTTDEQLRAVLPDEISNSEFDQKSIPRLAKNDEMLARLRHGLASLPTHHVLRCHDARDMDFLPDSSIHLVVTSPPYWTLKRYRDSTGQLGHVAAYEEFLSELARVWEHCFRALVPGGRVICVVGDVCLSRRQNNGRHLVMPLHASIQEQCRHIGFDNLAPIIWHKIANAAYEVDGGGGFLGKPFEPNAIIKNDIEFVLMLRKPGGYRKPSLEQKLLSIIGAREHSEWFQQIWTGIPGASTRSHPAPYPVPLAERLVRMFSFAGDVILDPFLGTATTSIACANSGRNSIGVEIDSDYLASACIRLRDHCGGLFSEVVIEGDAVESAVHAERG